MGRGAAAIVVGLMLVLAWALPLPALANDGFISFDSADAQFDADELGSALGEGLVSDGETLLEAEDEEPDSHDDEGEEEEEEEEEKEQEEEDDDEGEEEGDAGRRDHAVRGPGVRSEPGSNQDSKKHEGKEREEEEQDAPAVAAPQQQPPAGQHTAPAVHEQVVNDTGEPAPPLSPLAPTEAGATNTTSRGTTVTPKGAPPTYTPPMTSTIALPVSPRMLTLIAAVSLRNNPTAAPSADALLTTPQLAHPPAQYAGGLSFHQPLFQQIAGEWARAVMDPWRRLEPGPQGAIVAGAAIVLLAFGAWSGRRVVGTVRRVAIWMGQRRAE